VLPILDVHYQLAEALIGRHAFRSPLRSLDALQLAVAVTRSEQAFLDGFVLADQALSKVALAEKLAVVLVA
jgi:predicted nucleic acid-binding protein